MSELKYWHSFGMKFGVIDREKKERVFDQYFTMVSRIFDRRDWMLVLLEHFEVRMSKFGANRG